MLAEYIVIDNIKQYLTAKPKTKGPVRNILPPEQFKVKQEDRPTKFSTLIVRKPVKRRRSTSRERIPRITVNATSRSATPRAR